MPQSLLVHIVINASTSLCTATEKLTASLKKMNLIAVSFKFCSILNHFIKLLFPVALTDGHSVMLDVNGKPFMHTKGIVTRNIQSKWGILCDDDESFLSNGAVVAADICNFIGFKLVSNFFRSSIRLKLSTPFSDQ